MTSNDEVRVESAVAFRRSAAPHCARPEEVLSPEDDLRAARGILFAAFLSMVMWTGLGAVLYFTLG